MIIQHAERALLNERIRQHNFTLGVLKSKQQNLKDRIRGVLPEGTYNRVIDYTEHAQLREHHIVKNRQVAKFNRLRSEQKRSEEISRDNQGKNNKDKWVLNLSSRQLNSPETSVLQKGLNFAVVPEKPPINEVI